MPVLEAPSATLGERFVQVLTDPAALELLVLVALTVLLLLAFRRLGRLARELSKRRELREYVKGLSHLVNGEYASAVKYLARVVERDPEHTDARVALGDAYWQLGDAAEAHRHHYHVDQVYGRPSPRVSLSLGRDLAALGRAEEAVDHLARALHGEVEEKPARELLVETLAALGREGEAVAHVKGPAELTHPQIGRLHAAAGFRALGAGREREGVRHLQRALEFHPGLLAPRMALVGRRWLGGDAAGAWHAFRSHLGKVQQLAREGVVLETGAPSGGLRRVLEAERPGEVGPALPEGDEEAPSLKALPASVEVAEPGGGTLPAATDAARTPRDVLELGGDPAAGDLAAKDLGAMLEAVADRRARYRCRRCGAASARFEERCHRCGHFGALEPVQAARVRTGREIAEVIDEIEENRHYIARLVERLVAGDGTAAARLMRIGPKAIPEVFQRMMEVSDNRPLIAFLKQLGPECLDLIGNAYLHMRTFGSRNILREGLGIFRSFDGILREVLSSMGEGAVPYLRQCISHPDEGLRQVALEALANLGRGDVLEEAADVVPHAELVGCLNDASDAALLEVLRTIPAGGTVARKILPDRTFVREAVLVQALDRPETAGPAARAIEHRSFSPVLFEGLVARLVGPTAERAHHLLNLFLTEAHDHLVRVYTGPGLDVHRRAEVEKLLVRYGARSAEKIADELPLKDPERMAAVASLFQQLGEAGLAALERRYGKSSRFTVLGIDIGLGLGRDRSSQLRADLLRLMAAAGGDGARRLLERIAGEESDGELRALARRLRAGLEEGR